MQKRTFCRRALWVGVVLWTVFIWACSLQSAVDSSAASGRIVRLLMALIGWDTRPDWLSYAVRKTAHFAEFGVLGALWSGLSRQYPGRWMWLWGLPTAMVDECLQFFAPGRAPMVTDVLIDAAGYLWGGAVVLLLWRRKKEKTKDAIK